MKQSKLRLIKHKDGILECPCRNFPIGDTDLMYETVETRTPAGEIGRLIIRAYYKCFICNLEFNLKKVEGTGHWDYEDGVPNKDRVKLESAEDFNKAAKWIKDSTNLILSVQIADSKTKGYKFHCSNHPKIKCVECGRNLVNFITLDLDEAFQHSIRNQVPMWIAKDE